MKANATKTSLSSSRAAAARDGGNPAAGKSLPAVGGVMQLYKNNYVAKLKTSIESENGDYFLMNASGNASLYAKNTLGAPHYCTEANHDVNGSGVARYEPSDKFYADCLHTAEEIMNNKRLGSDLVSSKVQSTGDDFGEGIQKNWSAVKGVDDKYANENASPGVGDSFAIVGQNRHSYTGGILCQYHAAAVVASDGTDRITMEVFGNPNNLNRNVDAKFSIYDTDPKSKLTFHDVWGSSFKNGITVVLEKK